MSALRGVIVGDAAAGRGGCFGIEIADSLCDYVYAYGEVARGPDRIEWCRDR